MRKELSVILLPTSDMSNIVLFTGSIFNGRLVYTRDTSIRDSDEQDHHLYFLSDEPIEDGDWKYSKAFGICKHDDTEMGNYDTYKKIIATTDTSLKYIKDKNYISSVGIGILNAFLPQISETFIKTYINFYNDGNVINTLYYGNHNGIEYTIENPFFYVDGKNLNKNKCASKFCQMTDYGTCTCTDEKLFTLPEVKLIAWNAYHQCMIDNLTTGTDLDKNLPSIEDNIDKATFDKWFDKYIVTF
jgi:hypothetical protein